MGGGDAWLSLQTPRGGSRHAESKQTITAPAVAKSSPPCSLHHEPRAQRTPPLPAARTRLQGAGGSQGLLLQFWGGVRAEFWLGSAEQGKAEGVGEWSWRLEMEQGMGGASGLGASGWGV